MLISERIKIQALESPFITCLASIFVPFLLYYFTICPTIYWNDSPEFIDAAYNFGISHPAGSPTYSLISKIFTFFPFFSLSFKTNLVSLFFALFTIFLVCTVILFLLSLYYPEIKKKEANLIIILSSLFITTMPSLWSKAILAEVYSMTCFFMVLILYFLFKWSVKRDSKYLYLATFFYGLSSGVHAGVVMFLPGFLLFFLLVMFNGQNWRNYAPIKSFALLSLFFLLGFSVYLYLPVRSITNPEFDWGNPETLKNFFSHISDKKDSSLHFKNITQISNLLRDSFFFLKIAAKEITFIGMFLLISGMVVHLKKDWKRFLLLFLTAFLNILFYLSSTFEENKDVFVLSFVIFIIWIGQGIYFIRNIQIKFTQRANLRRLTAPVIVTFISFSVLMNYKNVEKSSYYLTEKIVKEMQMDMDTNSIFFSFRHWFPIRYLQDVENLRPDLIAINISDMKNPDVFNPITKERYPMIRFPMMASTKESFYDFWPLLIKENIRDRKMFVGLNHIIFETKNIHLIPHKNFLMQIVDKDHKENFDVIIDNYFTKLQKTINQDIMKDPLFFAGEEGMNTYYKIFLVNFANFLRVKNKFKKALLFLNLADQITVEDERKDISLMKAICLADLGRHNESASLFEYLLAISPNDKSILANLGNLHFKMKNYKLAEKYLKKAITPDDGSPNERYILGMTYFAQNRIEESAKEIKKAIGTSKNPLKRKRMELSLAKVLGN